LKIFTTGGITTETTTCSDKHREIVRIQRLRQFSHYNAARIFEDGARILQFDPVAAEKCFSTVIQIEPDNPYGYVYLLFALEDIGSPLGRLLFVCNKFVEVAHKKSIHGLEGISKEMMVQYLFKAEKMGLRIR
jgi:hypothetical protein